MPTATVESLSQAARKFVDDAPHGLFIGGEFTEAADGRTFATIDPATGEPICEVAYADAADVDRAVKAAQQALTGKWGTGPAAAREALMHRLADLIEENTEELAQLEALDNGTPASPRSPSPARRRSAARSARSAASSSSA